MRMRRFHILLAVWAALWMASFLVPALQEPTGDSFTKGLNRVATFFGFQIAAGLSALILIVLRPKTGLWRHLALIPGALALSLVLVFAWAIFGAEFGSSDLTLPVGPVTQPAVPVAPVK